MHVAVVTPASPVVTLAEAKAHLVLDHDEDDDLVEAFVAAATSHLDGPDGWLGRALGVQVLQATLEGFPCEPVELPCAPVSSINDVSYIATDGVETDVEADVYELTDDGRLRLEHLQYWPTPRSERDQVRVLYTAGYETLPAALRAAILLMTADLYANRESGGVGSVSFEFKMPTTVEALCLPYRVWRS